MVVPGSTLCRPPSPYFTQRIAPSVTVIVHHRRCRRPPPLTAAVATLVVSPPPPFVKLSPPLSSSRRSPVAMVGVSPPRSAPPPVLANNEDNNDIAVAFGAVVDTPNSCTQGPTTVNDKDNEESNVSIKKSNRLRNADDVSLVPQNLPFLHIFRGSAGR